MIAHRFLAAALLVLTAGALSAQGVDWTPAAARHLLNRAGFGGSPDEVLALHKLGLSSAVDYLLNQSQSAAARQLPPFVPEHLGRPSRETIRAAQGDDARRALIQESRANDRRQMEQIRGWWLHRMIQTPAPLEEKMVLFWHGHFTSGYQDVRNSYHMLRQHDLFRLHGMGNFRLLLHEVSRDPAMLAYLDNNENRKGRPNENFAREVMELFTVGIGNYTEKDIAEAARAFTGWTFQGNRFVATPRQHDSGTKTILGSEGKFTGTEVLDLLLATDAAPRTIAHKILSHFMGVEPSSALVDRHAEILRTTQYEIRPLLRSLFTSPEFYSEEVVAGQILSPVEYLVSLCRRLKEQPPAPLLSLAARQLGQDLFEPPNVKGWEGGLAWITTSSMLARGNFAGYLIQGVDSATLARDFAPEPKPEVAGAETMMQPPTQRAGRAAPRGFLRGLPRGGYKPTGSLSALVKDAPSVDAIVDTLCQHFLWVDVTEEARTSLIALLNEQVLADSRQVYERPSEARLRRLLRIILSLPEAQIG